MEFEAFASVIPLMAINFWGISDRLNSKESGII